MLLIDSRETEQFQENILTSGRFCNRSSVSIAATALHEFAESLGAAVDAKDCHTRQHSEEVADVSHGLALAIGLDQNAAGIIHVAAHLHDVGKIGVPDDVLQKAGPLNQKEFALIRQHPVIGADIVRPVAALNESGVLECILHHHERYDGKGYPDGLKGAAIPLGARIIAVADSFSAMMQSRPYRKALTFEQACKEILQNSCSQFDPAVVKVFSSNAKWMNELLQAASNQGGNGLTTPSLAMAASKLRKMKARLSVAKS